MSERRHLIAALAAALAAGPLLAWGQPAPEQTVWLKNGGFVRGALVELVPGDHITLQLVTGEIRKIPASEIDRTSSSSAPSGAPAASAAPTAPAPAPVAAASSAPAAGVAASAEQVMVRLVAPTGIELQAKPKVDKGGWAGVCAAPCGTWVQTFDREFRVTGPGVSPSRPFWLEPGSRPASVEVLTGSAGMYRWGQLGFLVGTPVLLLGGVSTGLGVGTNIEHGDTLRVVGLTTVIVSGAMLVASLPLLYWGRTRVLNDKGVQIAARPASGPLF